MRIFIGIVVSYLFIFIGICVASMLLKYKRLSDEGSRKFIHIYVGNWWLGSMIFFDSMWSASIVPLSFVLINYISYKKQLFKGMERQNQSENDLGTVYYAISLAVLTCITFWDKQYAYIGAIGILIMAYGDGLAAVIGKKYGKRMYKVGNVHKSIEGSMTMLLVSLCVTVLLLFVYTTLPLSSILIYSSLIAGAATLLEAFTPYGYDNLSVPLGASFICFLCIQYI